MRQALREFVVLLVVTVAAGGVAIALHPQLENRSRAGLEPGAVRLEEVRGWPVQVLWVDARNEQEFARDHIPGAVSLDEARFASDLGDVLAAWKPGQPIVVYCSSLQCGSSRAVAERLRAAGLDPVHHLHGGWEAWLEAAAAN